VLPTLDLVGAGLDFWMGSEQLDQRIRIVRAESVQIRGREAIPFSIDGETTMATTASFRILPGALRCVVGQNPPAFDESA
jgi:diacylglycerol kinase family enzyme